VNGKNKKLWAPTVLAALIALPMAAQAQNVWRCGNGYSDKPCENGQAVPIDESRPGKDAAAQARAAAQRDAKLAEQMEKERQAQEKNAAPALVMHRPQAATSAAAERPAKGKSSARKKKAPEPEYFTITVPAKAGEKKAAKKKG
jgi:hypothetical protein